MGHFRIWNGAIKSVAEGVGFEPTVGCPTLDFESSALNRTQPPFPDAEENFERSEPDWRKTSNIERRMQMRLEIGCSALNVWRFCPTETPAPSCHQQCY